MESTTANLVELQEKIQNAAYWRSEEEAGKAIGDATYNSFVQVMTYRMQIARNILRETDENKLKNLHFAFEHCNMQIKKVLGL